jgi:SAM-dependent methyltransferase
VREVYRPGRLRLRADAGGLLFLPGIAGVSSGGPRWRARRRRREVVTMSFDVAAEAYDGFMGRYSRLLSAQLADLAGVRSGQRVLDVGCGTGALTGELVRRVGAASVAAVDPSASFVAATRERHPGVDVRPGTADALPFDDGTFDAVLAQLVVHFMPDPVAGIAGMRRATRPVGVVAACVWDHAGRQGPLRLFWDAVRELDPDVDDEAHLPGTRAGHLEELFATVGLHEIEGRALAIRLEHPSFDAWWEPFTRGVGPAGAYLARVDPARREAIREAARGRIAHEPFDVIAVAWAARGIA